ncbi:tRNA CCA-pyrophosphorylase [Alcaligenes faecalis]|uniref:tRNA CCA-pyrophosphorylase n=1 Tax=Alcaligenes faecalis TaxID=511 RepID=UPI0006C72457|nr:tRNA CCA-pyrophosphorylase [Alcaligenes faecalis]MCX5595934.1 tRNA CCA-pyrophosphorylase [Alcaligenes faecalis]GAU74850.1 tRNA CCA-pyrophosphorylase [Alcaligenes faecalis subsp. faecalis NBRC 13111]CUI79842.1 Multifunctional CCA protein [Alcaligenes faecalis]
MLDDRQRAALAALMGPPDPVLEGLQVYVVGGAVRDALLGMPAGDKDWVVVGARPEDLAARGFVPVGGDFPVFLNPHSKEEFALARTERKSGRGYKGFTFYTGTDVSLADDLRRRDLTINAMAVDAAGNLHDPLNGLADLQARLFRHVGTAFSEDPVRLLRLARFAARFTEFTVADDTWALARELVEQGEVDELVPERIYLEIAKGLSAQQPARMFEVLREVGALERVMPGLNYNDQVGQQVQIAKDRRLDLASCFAVLCHISDTPGQVAEQIRAPSEWRDQARLLPVLLASPALLQPRADVESALQVMESLDVLRKPERFIQLISAAACLQGVPELEWDFLRKVMASVDAGAVAAQYKAEPSKIRGAVRAARLAALEQSV